MFEGAVHQYGQDSVDKYMGRFFNGKVLPINLGSSYGRPGGEPEDDPRPDYSRQPIAQFPL